MTRSDPTRPFEDTPKIIRSRRRTERHLKLRRGIHRAATISDKLTEHFGENPCKRLTLHNDETGDNMSLTCDSKRCHDCGPRKQWILKQQLAALGERVWAATTKDIGTLNRALERLKKQHQRNGLDFTYNIVGDDYLGYIIVSNVQIIPEQRWMALKDWMDRIVHAYRYGDNRIRRSRVLGRMSLIPIRVGGKLGTSVWRAVFNRSRTQHDEILDAIIDVRDAENPANEWHVWDEDGVTRSSLSV